MFLLMITVAMGTSPKSLEYLVILYFQRGYPKQNTVVGLK